MKLKSLNDQLVVGSIILVIMSAVIFVFAYGLWRKDVASRPTYMFWSALDRALSIKGVNTYMVTTGSQKARQATDYRFAGVLQASTTFSAQTANGGSVKSETFATPQVALIRYSEIKGQNGELNPKYADKWLDASPELNAPEQLLTNNLSSPLIFLANFNYQKRQNFVKLLKDKKVFVPERVIEKQQNVKGRDAVVIEFTVNPDAYKDAKTNYLESLGLSASAEQVRQNQNNLPGSGQPYEIAIDLANRQIVAVGTPTLESQNTMFFTNWGVKNTLPSPSPSGAYDATVQQNLTISK